MAQFTDYYKILEVTPSDGPDIIKEAYKKLSWLYHPDRNKNPGAEEKFKEISEAYTVLKDPTKRKEYDSQYYKSKGSHRDDKDTTINKPKPVVDKPYIMFDDVTPGEIKTDSFTLRNSGGNYENIDVSVQTPNSWLKITGLNSLDPNQSDEIPLKIEIEASADEWGKNYTEYIVVKLDDEELRIKVELNTKSKAQQPPAFNKKKLIPIIIIPIFFIIISCTSIYYIFNRINRQDGDVVETIAETEDSSVEENVVSSNDETEQEIVPREFNFNGKVAYLKEGQGFDGSHDIDAVYILDSRDNRETYINLDMYWVEPVSKNLSWSPDGTELVIGFGMDLYILNVIDGSVKEIYSLKTDRVDDEDSIDSRGYFEIVSWSPDGQKILVTVTPYNGGRYADEAVSNKIILIERDGSNEQILLENYKLRYLGIAWSPDGSNIIFSTGKSRHYYLLDEYVNVKESFDFYDYVKLWKMDFNTNNIIQIADFTGWQNSVNHDGYYIHNCKWSPDGKEVLFDLVYSLNGPHGYDVEKSMIYTINLDGSNVEEFLQGYSPNWSVDGNKIIYGGISYNEDYELPIIITDKTSGESEIISWGFNPAWHPYD